LEFGEEHYNTEYFTDRGYRRQRCSSCGKYFWALRERATCGEAPCEPYTFIGAPPSNGPRSVAEMRREFLEFFRGEGHKVVEPYPVVPRWRRDLYLVSASIVDFQPHVTSGATEPPANPLVISQPCIRMVDLGKVGLTLGRHLTIFEMGGAHAFNFPGREIYWKDRTVELCIKFMERLGLSEDEVVLKEGIWSGGGNAGPCYEVVHSGLEVATLVFMSYRTLDGALEELSVRTVDTGYGIERYSWLSQGTPTAFEVIYKDVIGRLSQLIDMPTLDDEEFTRYARFSAWINPDAGGSLREARKVAADLAGVDLDKLLPELEKLESFYKLLDHTKSIAFILADGVVPSNSKVGYLARLLIRRSQRILETFGSGHLLPELVDLQIQHWGRDFPRLLDMRDEIFELIEFEVKRFRESLERGLAQLGRELKELSKRRVAIDPEFVVKLYEERGITPDVVLAEAEKRGISTPRLEEVEARMITRHLEPMREKMSEELVVAARLVENLPRTVRLYYLDQYAFKFTARVIAASNGMVVLDQTLFYPEGGGQVGDTGYLRWAGGGARVKDTQMIDGVIVHFVEGELPPIGVEVNGEVDYGRRLGVMRHHTATHILIGAVRRVLGKHAWQMGARKEADSARLDISHHKPLTVEEVAEIERLANEAVANRMPVKVSWLSRSVAEEQYGFTLYQGGEAPLGEVRVVEIEGWDAEACGGTHVTNTSEVGLVKIVKVERIQDGVVRLLFAAGPSALKHINEELKNMSERLEILEEEAKRLKGGLNKVIESYQEWILRGLENTGGDWASRLEEAEAQLASLAARAWLYSRSYQKEEDIGGVKLIFDFRPVFNETYYVTLAREAIRQNNPAAAMIVGRIGDTLFAAIGINRASLKQGAKIEEMVALLAPRRVWRIEEDVALLEFEGWSVREIYGAFRRLFETRPLS